MTADPAYVGSAGKSGALGADPVVDLSGIVADGYFMVALGRAGGALALPDGTWTQSPAVAGVGTNHNCGWRFWHTGDPTSFTFVTTGSVNSVIEIGVFAGVDPTTPVDDSDGILGAGAMIIPSVDIPVGGNRLLVMMAVKLQTGATWTFSAGNERWDGAFATSNFVGGGADQAGLGAGATGTRTATPSSGAGNGVAYAIVLNPVAVATNPGAGFLSLL